MARFCPITGKRTATGNNVSHSQRKTKRKWKPNLVKKTLINPATGEKVRIKISTTGLRTLMKNYKANARRLAIA